MRIHRSLMVICTGVAICAAGFALWKYLAVSAPSRVTNAFIGTLERMDWHGMYRMSPDTEYAANGISEAQFVTMMTELSKGLGPLKPSSDRIVDTGIPGEHLEIMTFPRPKGKPFEYQARIWNAADGWHSTVNTLPIGLASMHGEKPAYFAILADALEKANIRELPIIEGHIKCSPDRIRQYVKGDIPISGIYRRL